MRTLAIVVIGILALASSVAQADEATEQAVVKSIMDANAFAKKNLKDSGDNVAKDGSLEFWSSGGLLNNVPADGSQQEYESFDIDAKHITVITLVPGQIAVAQYYSDGSMHPKGSAPVTNYRTRVTQVFVKEGSKWKIRAAHFSPITGGSGTSQTSVTQ